MIGSDLEGAGLESRMASWAASAISDDAAAVRAHVPADAGAVRRGLLRHLASPPPGFGHVPLPLALAEHDAAPGYADVYLPVQGPCR
jgi:hypothetical protein